ncbi:MAG: NAD(+)/NADH kinase [Dehalococcoidia bacterium]|nr:NAD(+)/NADH kinase [Dehalococcoidia bacterium]
MLKRVAILHHPHSEGAAAFARQLEREFTRRDVQVGVSDVWADGVPALIPGSGLVICIGGDGTVLRAARVSCPDSPPLMGINMGRLGFLTDMSPRDFFNHFERVLAGDWRVEERIMVRADVFDGPESPMEYHGLNDIVISRQSPGRPIYVDVRVDHALVAVYRCDGIIVSTPTGSTGYSLSAGGPILSPTEHHLVVTPVSAHLALGRSLVLEQSSEVELRVTSDHGAILSVDGQEDVPVGSGTLVRVRVSEHVTRFARFRDPASFYAELAERLEFQLSSTMSRA